MNVLFVSKPIEPPFHDGAKCLVRDIASHLCRASPTVMCTPDAPPLGGRVRMDSLYRAKVGFAPALSENARVLGRLLLSRAPDVWHFVFAPNPRSCAAGKLAKRLRGVPIVQTVASCPKTFHGSSRLLFGDRIVALSKWTEQNLLANGADAKALSVIPPALSVPHIDDEKRRRARREAGLPEDVPLVVYPGDLEVSNGARLMAEAVPDLLARHQDVIVVFACRQKTQHAKSVEAGLRLSLQRYGSRVRFVGEVADLPALLASSTVTAFPVDNLYGKVDLPIALLEAMALGVPLLVLDQGPLLELAGARTVAASASEIARSLAELLANPSLRAEHAGQARETIRVRHDPPKVAAAYEQMYDDLLR